MAQDNTYRKTLPRHFNLDSVVSTLYKHPQPLNSAHTSVAMMLTAWCDHHLNKYRRTKHDCNVRRYTRLPGPLIPSVRPATGEVGHGQLSPAGAHSRLSSTTCLTLTLTVLSLSSLLSMLTSWPLQHRQGDQGKGPQVGSGEGLDLGDTHNNRRTQWQWPAPFCTRVLEWSRSI